MKKINKLKAGNLQLAKVMLHAGRPASFVKAITAISVAEMQRQGWLYEVKIPHPDGYITDPTTGETKHDGRILNTGKLRPTFSIPEKPSGKSNKQLKRENRKAFFD